jgi:hypothetical protein
MQKLMLHTTKHLSRINGLILRQIAFKEFSTAEEKLAFHRNMKFNTEVWSSRVADGHTAGQGGCWYSEIQLLILVIRERHIRPLLHV